MMRNILFASHSAMLTGAPNVLFNIAAGMDRTRFQPLVLFPARGPIVQKFEQAGVPVSVIEIGDNRWEKSHAPMIEAFCAVKKIDIIHANTLHSLPFVIAARELGIPCFWYIHEMLGSELQFQAPDAEFRESVAGAACLGAACLGAACRGAASIGAPSDACRLQFLEYCRSRQIEPPDVVVVPHGFHAPEIKDFREIGNRFKVLAIGNLAPHKGYTYLIEAFAEIVSSDKNVQGTLDLLAAGDLRHLPPLWEQVERAGLENQVHFHTPVPDIAGFISNSDIIVNSSLVENFSLSLGEAMARGKPIVATDVGGIREFFTDGETGLIVPPKNPKAIAQAIGAFLKDHQFARRCGQKARERIVERFPLQKQVNQLQDIYASLIEAQRFRGKEQSSRDEISQEVFLKSIISLNEKVSRLEREAAANKEYLMQRVSNVEEDIRILENVVKNVLSRFPFRQFRKLKKLLAPQDEA